MASEQTNGHGESRLDRLEGLVEVLVNEHIAFAEEHKLLLTSQVLMTDSIRELTGRVKDLAAEVAESHKSIDDRLSALIQIVDGLIRNRPQAS
jgi:hypothetical protein